MKLSEITNELLSEIWEKDGYVSIQIGVTDISIPKSHKWDVWVHRGRTLVARFDRRKYELPDFEQLRWRRGKRYFDGDYR
jgi:hypothetical protein